MDDRFGLWNVRRWAGMLVVGLALVCGAGPVFAAGAVSSPQERARFVSITQSLEKAPLDPQLQADRQWALQWLTDAPDISVTVCLDTIVSAESDYAYEPEILLQYMFSMAVLSIEHPDRANDPDAQQLAGAEGALRAYRAILRDKPEAHSAGLDAMLAAQDRGDLPAFVRKASLHCSKKS